LSISNVSTNNPVVVTNGAGAVTNAIATLTVLVAPAIVAQPQSLTVTQGASAAFSVVASGTGPLNYRWRFNGVNLSGNLSTYALGNVRTNKAGDYSVVVTNGAGAVTSTPATLSVLVPPVPQPGWFDSISRLPDGSVRLGIGGTPGCSYALECTSNREDWVNLCTLSNADGCF
jgi:hypothetical protein